MTQVYTAGPFFNEQQEKHAIELASKLRERGFGVYAPVEHKYEEQKSNATEIFMRNIKWMFNADILLFQLDYPMDDGEQLILRSPIDGDENVSLPDSGTVWEMGYGYCLRRVRECRLIGYHTLPVQNLNLMLAQCLDGIAENLWDVFLPDGKLDLTALTDFSGRQI